MITRKKTIALFLFVCGNYIYSFSQQCTVNGGSNITICQNASGIITAIPTGGTVNTYTWNTIPPTSPTIGNPFNIPTGLTGPFTYTVTAAFQGGCSASDTILVTVNPLPNIPTISFTPNTPQCAGTSINFSTVAQGGVAFLWNFGDGTPTATGSSVSHSYNPTVGNGTVNYTVTLIATISSTGCSSSFSTTIQVKKNPESILIDLLNNPQFIGCSGGNFNLIVGDGSTNTYTNYAINWGDGSPNYSSTIPPSISPGVTHSYLNLGYFTLTYTVSNSNGCSASSTYSVFNGGNPQVGLANPGGTTGLCTPTTLSFPINNVSNNAPGTIYIVTTNDGSPPDTFQHPPPANYVHQFLNTSCGTNSPGYSNSFYVRIQAMNPCASSSATVEPITTNSLPQANFSISPDTIVCTNTIVNFTNTSNGGAWVNSQNQCDTTKIVNWIITPTSGFTITSGTLGNNPPNVNVPSTWGSNTLNVQFNSPGIYSISLFVRTRNNCGNDTITKTVCIQAPPTPSFTATPLSGCNPLVVNFTNTSIGLHIGSAAWFVIAILIA